MLGILFLKDSHILVHLTGKAMQSAPKKATIQCFRESHSSSPKAETQRAENGVLKDDVTV